MINLAFRTFERSIKFGLRESKHDLPSIRAKTYRIMTLLVINVSLTLFMELVWREVLAGFSSNPELNRFFVVSATGYGINQQSLINITMTALATVIGSWVLFGPNLFQRFFYFVGSGLIIAAFAQVIVYFTTTGHFALGVDRMFFDIVYTCAVKFPIFECGRRALIRKRVTLLKLFRVRIAQDSVMSMFRITLLNFFRIH